MARLTRPALARPSIDILRVSRTALLLVTSYHLAVGDNPAAALTLGLTGVTTVALWRLRCHTDPATSGIDTVPALQIAMIALSALLTIAAHPGDLTAPIGQRGTPGATYEALLLTAALPAALIDRAVRALWGWARISLVDDDAPRPWTDSIAAAAAVVLTLTLLAYNTPDEFRRGLTPATALLLIFILGYRTVTFLTIRIRLLRHRPTPTMLPLTTGGGPQEALLNRSGKGRG